MTTTTKKIIGTVPISRGEWDPNIKYYKLNIVTYLGSVFISTVNENTAVPCIIADNKFIVREGWEFFVDNSETYFLKYKEIDLPQEEFDKLKELGLLDITKDYYTYEE